MLTQRSDGLWIVDCDNNCRKDCITGFELPQLPALLGEFDWIEVVGEDGVKRHYCPRCRVAAMLEE